jgi:glycerol uptake facilitator-like aquaporin
MRKFGAAALFAVLTTFVVALSLRAPDATVALLAVAGITVLVTWFAGQHSTEEESGLALANPASAVALTLVGRSNGATILPLIAAQVVGAVVGGLAALGLAGELGDTLIWSEPRLLTTGIAVGVLGILATWLLFAIDAQISEGFAAIPPLLTGASLPLSLGSALNPAVILGLATADLISWDVALVAATAALVAAVIGAYTINVISPAEQ